MNPTVSVVIPTFNRARVLQRAIASALNQSFQGIDVLVIDDGSTDETADVVRSIDDNRLVYIGLPSNVGVSGARNVGIKEACGEYVAFLDSDDEWPWRFSSDHLSVQPFLKLPSLGVAYRAKIL